MSETPYTPLTALMSMMRAQLPAHHLVHRLNLFEHGGITVGRAGCGKSVAQDLMVLTCLARNPGIMVDIFHDWAVPGIKDACPQNINAFDIYTFLKDRKDVLWMDAALAAGVFERLWIDTNVSIHESIYCLKIWEMYEQLKPDRFWAGFQMPDQVFRYDDPATRDNARPACGSDDQAPLRFTKGLFFISPRDRFDDWAKLGVSEDLFQTITQRMPHRCMRPALIGEYGKFGQPIEWHVVETQIPNEVWAALGPILHYDPHQRMKMKLDCGGVERSGTKK